MTTTLAILAAAGQSQRAGNVNKLCVKDPYGIPLIMRSLKALLQSKVDHVQILLPPEKDRRTPLEYLLPNPSKRLSFQIALAARQGFSQTLKTGFMTAYEGMYDNLMLALGDMPYVSATHYNRLLAYKEHSAKHIIATSVDHQRQPPILWDRQIFSHLLHFNDSQQRRSWLRRLPPSFVTDIPLERTYVKDFDTPSDLEQYRKKGSYVLSL